MLRAHLHGARLDKAVVASFSSLLPPMKSVGFKLLKRTNLANVGASGARKAVVIEKDLLANDGRYERPIISPDAVAVDGPERRREREVRTCLECPCIERER